MLVGEQSCRCAIYPTNSNFFEKPIEAKITSILDDFFDDARSVKDERLGQPERVVFLLHEPPGTGKTRLVQYLAGKYSCPLNVMSAGKDQIRITQTQMPTISSRSIVLLDEMDKAFDGESDVGSKVAQLSVSLDGESAPTGVVIFLVANDISKLPPSLIRSRRVHYIIKLTEFSSDLIARAGNYWSEGKMELTSEDAKAFDGKFVGAEIIQALSDLRREKRLTKKDFLDDLSKLHPSVQ
jgi:SpoVK/Ycf46/Vps4 family AAA+-type ATPase